MVAFDEYHSLYTHDDIGINGVKTALYINVPVSPVNTELNQETITFFAVFPTEPRTMEKRRVFIDSDQFQHLKSQTLSTFPMAECKFCGEQEEGIFNVKRFRASGAVEELTNEDIGPLSIGTYCRMSVIEAVESHIQKEKSTVLSGWI